jgi:hypothetical protein
MENNNHIDDEDEDEDEDEDDVGFDQRADADDVTMIADAENRRLLKLITLLQRRDEFHIH